MLELIGNILIFVGACFNLIASLGLFRLKGPFLKMHAGTKAATVSNGFILVGVGLQMKGAHQLTDIFLLILFIAITNPISAHLIARYWYSLTSEA